MSKKNPCEVDPTRRDQVQVAQKTTSAPGLVSLADRSSSKGVALDGDQA